MEFVHVRDGKVVIGNLYCDNAVQSSSRVGQPGAVPVAGSRLRPSPTSFSRY